MLHFLLIIVNQMMRLYTEKPFVNSKVLIPSANVYWTFAMSLTNHLHLRANSLVAGKQPIIELMNHQATKTHVIFELMIKKTQDNY